MEKIDMIDGKRSYKLLIKSLGRKRISSFIRNQFSEEEMLLVKVLCLPGREAIELIEIYDKLGIPRENITCLEFSGRIYNELKRRNLGVRLFHGSLKAFTEQSPSRFDIVSLDFMGQVASEENNLYRLARNGFLSEKCVIYTNFFGARETSRNKGHYALAHERNVGFRSDTFIRQAVHAIRNGEELDSDTVSHVTKKFEEIFKSDLKTIRSEAIHEVVRNAICIGSGTNLIEIAYNELDKDGSLTREVEDFWGRTPDYSDVPTELRDLIRQRFEAAKSKENAIPMLMMIRLQDFALEEIENLFYERMNHLRYNVFTPKFVSYLLFNASLYVMAKPRKVITEDSFKYISDAGAPMYSDLFALKQVNPYEFIVPYLDPSAKTFSAIFERLLLLDGPKLTKLLDDCFLTDSKLQKEDKLPKRKVERSFLGSEKKLKCDPLPARVLSLKEKALRMIAGNPGATAEDIMLATGAKKMQAAAWKAHASMGTYSSIANVSINPIELKFQHVLATKRIPAKSLSEKEIYALEGFAQDSRDYLFALNLNNHLISLNPKNEIYWFNRIALQFGAGRLSAIPSTIKMAKEHLGDNKKLSLKHSSYLKDLKEYDGAIAVLLEALDLFPQDEEIITDLSNTFALNEMPSEALEYLSLLYEHFPGEKCQLQAAKVHTILKDYDKALPILNDAISRNPTYVSLNYRGILLAETNQYVEALADFEAASKLNGNSDGILFNIGTLHLHLERPDLAIAPLMKALQLDPKDLNSQFNLGVCYIRKDRLEEACRIFQDLAEKKHNVENSIWNLSLALEKDGKISDACKYAKELTALQPSNTLFRNRYAYLLLALDQTHKALKEFKQITIDNPRDETAFVRVGTILILLGRPKQSLSYLEKAFELNPSSVEASYTLGIALQDLEKYNEALAVLTLASVNHSDNPKVQVNLANTYARINQFKKAIECYDKAIDIAPGEVDAWFNKGVVLQKLGEIKQAIECYEKCLEIDSHEYQAACNLGVAYLDSGDLQNGLFALTLTLSINPFDVTAARYLEVIHNLLEKESPETFEDS